MWSTAICTSEGRISLQCAQLLPLTTHQLLAHTELRQIRTPLLPEGLSVLLLSQTVAPAIAFEVSNLTPFKGRTQSKTKYVGKVISDKKDSECHLKTCVIQGKNFF